jgi:hypothetical protein
MYAYNLSLGMRYIPCHDINTDMRTTLRFVLRSMHKMRTQNAGTRIEASIYSEHHDSFTSN